MSTHFVLDARAATDHFPGIGRYVSNLAHALVPHLKRDEKLILLCDPTDSDKTWKLPRPVGRVHHVDTDISPFSLRQHQQIPRLLKSLDADLYHSPYYLMPSPRTIPTITTIYDLIPELFPEQVSTRARRLFRWTMARTLRRSADLICISAATGRDLTHRYTLSDPPNIIPLAPDPIFKPAEPAQISTLRRQYALDTPFILYLGINKPHKNLERLVQAWSLTDSAHQLVIAGRWDDRYPEARELASALKLGDRIRFLGPIPEQELPVLYSAADLFVFPSLYEGFGLPVIEAMACGTAVACSYTSSLPEVGGLAAMYFNPNDAGEIAYTLTETLKHTARLQMMREKSRVQAQKFSWRETAMRTLTLYQSLT